MGLAGAGVRVGTSGFPMGRAAYFREFPAVEIDSSFYNLPRAETAARWAEEAPPGFAYAVKAWQLVTHPSSSPGYRRLSRPPVPRVLERCGHFRSTDEVAEAGARTMAFARACGAKFVLFQTPASFYPQADHLRDMYRFFKAARRGETVFVWEPRGEAWQDSLVEKVSRDLDLSVASDLFRRPAVAGRHRYYRLQGSYDQGRYTRSHAYSSSELSKLADLCTRDGRPSYVFFSNLPMLADARRLRDLIAPLPRPSSGPRPRASSREY